MWLRHRFLGFLSGEFVVFITEGYVSSMFADSSHLIGPISALAFLFVGFLFFASDVYLPKPASVKAKKFNSLHSRFRHCLTVLEYSHPTKQAEIENILPFFKELDISYPSREYATIPMWKDFCNQLIRLTETEDESVMNRNLEKAQQSYSSDELERWHRG